VIQSYCLSRTREYGIRSRGKRNLGCRNKIVWVELESMEVLIILAFHPGQCPTFVWVELESMEECIHLGKHDEESTAFVWVELESMEVIFFQAFCYSILSQVWVELESMEVVEWSSCVLNAWKISLSRTREYGSKLAGCFPSRYDKKKSLSRTREYGSCFSYKERISCYYVYVWVELESMEAQRKHQLFSVSMKLMFE